ncbi:MAG: hypothetical protein HY711_08080, partial [Candidatus Melainabacteria bacterium]|nr:hypothetical protein [Candidatus Melainabacteria bacterium]
GNAGDGQLAAIKKEVANRPRDDSPDANDLTSGDQGGHKGTGGGQGTRGPERPPDIETQRGGDRGPEGNPFEGQNPFITRKEGMNAGGEAFTVRALNEDPPRPQPATFEIGGKPVSGVIEPNPNTGKIEFKVPGQDGFQRFQLNDVGFGSQGNKSVFTGKLTPLDGYGNPQPEGSFRTSATQYAGRDFQPVVPREPKVSQPPGPEARGTEGKGPAGGGVEGRGPESKLPPVPAVLPVGDGGGQGKGVGPQKGAGTGGDGGSDGGGGPGKGQGRQQDGGEGGPKIRAPEVLARDVQEAERKYKESGGADPEARTRLEGLRQEFREAKRQDDSYAQKFNQEYQQGKEQGRSTPADKLSEPPRPERPSEPQSKIGEVAEGPRDRHGKEEGGAPKDVRGGRGGEPPVILPPGIGLPGKIRLPGDKGEQGAEGTAGGDKGIKGGGKGDLPFGDPKFLKSLLGLLDGLKNKDLNMDKLDPLQRQLIDKLKLLDPVRLEGLRKLLTQTDKEGKAGDPTIIAKIRELFEGGKPGKDKMPLDQSKTDKGGEGLPRDPITVALLKFFKEHKETFGRLPLEERSKAILQELGKFLKELNKEMGLTLEKGLPAEKGGITIKDILGKTLEKGQHGKEEAGTFGVKLTAAQEILLRAQLEKLATAATSQSDAISKLFNIETSQRVNVDLKVADVLGAGAKTEVGTKTDLPIKDQGDKVTTTAAPLADAAAVAAQQIDVAVSQKTQEELVSQADAGDQSFEGEEEKLKEEDEKRRLMEAELVALAARKEKEQDDAEKEKQEEEERNKKKTEGRRRYVVQLGDTLESIASKMLGDSGLAQLILDINSSTIPVRSQGGKKVVDLKPKMVLWLHNSEDIKEFLGRIFG